MGRLGLRADHPGEVVNRILWNRRPDPNGFGGDIDEIVATNVTVHIEQMDEGCWWIELEDATGATWSGNFHTYEPGLTFGQQEQDPAWRWDRDEVQS
jgi:hypothetical protein